jgi:hypothetical protein
VGTVPKSNKKIIEICKIDTVKHKHMFIIKSVFYFLKMYSYWLMTLYKK